MLSSIFRGLVGLSLLVGLVGSLGQPAHAQSDARRKAEEALRNGIKAQSQRDHRSALQLLSMAINSSALGRSELAIALYRRAISYRGQKQPARAISDINSALFFKGALPAKDRANAIELRLQAYRDAGLKAPVLATSTPRAPSSAALQAPSGSGRPGPRIINTVPPRVTGPVHRVAPRQSLSRLPATAPILGESSSGSQASVSAPERVTPRISAFATEIRRGSVPAASVPTFTTRAAPPASSVASVRSQAAVTSRRSWLTETSLPPVRVAATTTSAAAQAGAAGTYATALRSISPTVSEPKVSAPKAWRGTSVSTRGVPGGSVSRAPSPTPRRVTPSREVASAAAPAQTSKGGQGLGGFFSSFFGESETRESVVPQATSAVSRPTRQKPVREGEHHVAAAAVPSPSAPAAEPRAPRVKGYDIELAALSDRFRAEAIAKQVMVQYSSEFYWSSRKTRVDERAGLEGNVIYAVRLGLYGDEASAQDFCGTLKADGFGCEIVARR